MKWIKFKTPLLQLFVDNRSVITTQTKMPRISPGHFLCHAAFNLSMSEVLRFSRLRALIFLLRTSTISRSTTSAMMMPTMKSTVCLIPNISRITVGPKIDRTKSMAVIIVQTSSVTFFLITHILLSWFIYIKNVRTQQKWMNLPYDSFLHFLLGFLASFFSSAGSLLFFVKDDISPSNT